MKESPYTYLMGLAISDLTVLVMLVTQSVLHTRFGRGCYACGVYGAYIFLPVGNTFANASIWITVLLTTERWISVRFPLKTKDLCTRSLARKAVIMTYFASAVVNVPRMFSHTMKLQENSTDVYEVTETEFGSSRIYKAVIWFYIAAVLFIPCVILVALNSALVWLVYKATVKRNALLHTHLPHLEYHALREQTRLTVTCISIIILFLVCMLPAAFTNENVAYYVFATADFASEEEFLRSTLYDLIRTTANTLLVCNLSLNFVLYCLFNNKFTRTLKHLFNDCLLCVVCKQTAPQRFSRRSSTSSGGSFRHYSHRWSRRSRSSWRRRTSHAPFAQQWNALYFNVEVYPLSNVTSSTRCERANGGSGKSRFHTELFSHTEVSEL